MVKCRHACPVHTDACGYVTAIAEGRYEEAYRIARATNPFASICGRVCGAPCEANCRRGDVDAPVAIRAPEALRHRPVRPGNRRLPAVSRSQQRRACCRPNRGDYERVAVVGAGVSGLTVAHDLVQIGLQGDGLRSRGRTRRHAHRRRARFPPAARTGAARNPRHPLAGRGAEVQQRLGRDFTIADLRHEGYKAIFLGIGLPKGRKLPLPGADSRNVHRRHGFSARLQRRQAARRWANASW